MIPFGLRIIPWLIQNFLQFTCHPAIIIIVVASKIPTTSWNKLQK